MCVVTTFYTLEGMKSLFLPKFVFFSFKATPFSQKHKFIILLFYLVFTSVALRIITYRAPSRREPNGRFAPEGGRLSGRRGRRPLRSKKMTEGCATVIRMFSGRRGRRPLQ